MQADDTLDCMGLYCPMPIVKTAQKIKQLQKGQVLEIVADDPGIKEEADGEIKVYVRKTQD